MSQHPVGLINQIAAAGIESKELAVNAPQALIGGARIPYQPKDLASIITILRTYQAKTYLALEAQGRGGFEFMAASIGGLVLKTIIAENDSAHSLRTYLRNLDDKFDAVTVDGRGVKLAPDQLWKYLQGGKGEPTRKFGAGAPTQYGSCKLKPHSIIILNLLDPETKELFFQLRARHQPVFSSPFVGVVRLAGNPLI